MANRRNDDVVEDCLKTIYTVGEWDPAARTVTEIAARMRASTSTTSALVRRLAADGLVEHEPYGDVALSPAGLARALRVVRRHRLIETFLVEHLHYSWDEVHDEAEVLEHTISDLMLDRIDAAIGHPWRDPHGDAIPTTDGVLHLPEARPLAELEPGESGHVVRILDDSPDLLRWLVDRRVGLDLAVEVVERQGFAGTVTVRLGDRAETLDVGLQAADALWVGPDLPWAAAGPDGCHYPRCHRIGAPADAGVAGSQL